MLEVVTNSPEETRELGRKVGESLKGGEVILLHGDLGAGKTLFTKGVAQGLGASGRTAVVSPTFTLVNVYQARLDIVHVDLYRLSFDEVFELGLEDYMDGEHVLIVEWAEKAAGFFSGALLDVSFQYEGETSRRVTMDTAGFELNLMLPGRPCT